MPKMVSAETAIKEVLSGHNVFIHSAAATPQQLVKALVARTDELRAVKIYSIHTEGVCSYARQEYADSFQVYSFFNGHNIREARSEIALVFTYSNFQFEVQECC